MKIYASITEDLTDIDTFTAIEFGTIKSVAEKIESIISKYDTKSSFSYTIYDKIHGLLAPVFSRRGTVRDIIADMASGV